MALILHLETATTNCSVSLAAQGEILAVKEHNSANYSHAEELHQFIQAVMQQAGRSMQELSAIAVSKGPGSYTGLRIGVSTAKGLCFALEIPLISLPTLKILAMHKRCEAGLIIPVLDARRMEVYSAVYDCQYNPVRDTRAEVVDGESFADYANSERVYVLGNGAEKCREVLNYPNFEFDAGLAPSARQMAIPAYEKYLQEDFENTAYFEPYYLKDFIAHKKK